MPKRVRRSGRIHVAAARGATLLLVLVVAAACSADSGTLGGVGGASELEAMEPQAAELPSNSSSQMTPALRAAYIASLQRNAGPDYDFKTDSGGAVARTPAHGLTAKLADGAMRVEPTEGADAWSFELRWTGIGRGDDISPVQPPTGGIEVEGNRAAYHRADGSEEWYVNGPLGIEQGFVLTEPVMGDPGELVIEMTVSGGLVPQVEKDGAEITLLSPDGVTAARYGELYVHDAEGNALAASIEIVGVFIRLVISDTGAKYPLSVDPLIWVEQQKLLASDGAADDQFGSAVALSGDTALAGAPWDGDNGMFSGSAYVFARSGNTWTPQAKLLASDGAMHDLFGTSVALSGDTALVGGHGNDNQGAAYVFVRSGTVWTEQQKLLANDGAVSDIFGIQVALEGDTALVSAWLDDDNGTDSGSAYVFVRSGSVWTEQQMLLPNDGAPDEHFGISGSVSVDTVLVGAAGDDDNGALSGSAYVFVRNGSVWTQQQKLLSSDGAFEDHFGSAVSVSGDTALVGAQGNDDNGTGSGSGYVFLRSSNVWTEQQKLLASDGAQFDSFGSAVSVSGDTALLGAWGDGDSGPQSGSVYAFELRKTDGEPCALPSDCVSTFCVDGVCCDTNCAASDPNDCQACSVVTGALADGICGPSTGNACDDGRYCTGADTCQSGACVGAGDPCAANVGDPDTDCSESCNEASDDCTANDPDGVSCDDGDACTPSDSCGSGACTGNAPVTCSAADECHDIGACDPGTGVCSNPNRPDGSPCTGGTCQTGVCEPATPAAGPNDDGGCGCRLEGSRTPARQWAALCLVGLGLVFARRRQSAGYRRTSR